MDTRETFQLRRMASTRDDGYKLGDGVIYYRVSIYCTLGFTLREKTLRELHDTLSPQRSRALYEHEVQRMGLQRVLGCIIRRQDNRFIHVIEQEHNGST